MRAHPPGVAPEASDKCVTPSRALVRRIVGRYFCLSPEACLTLFRWSWLIVGKPPRLFVCEVDRGPLVF
jgi:hypothetical protein